MKKSLVYMFFATVGIISLVDIFNSEKYFSEIENRYLKKKPKFTTDKLLSGDYTKDYEEYINDNFLGRDSFINIKSLSESVLLKLENNNIVYGDDSYLFEKKLSVNEEILSENIERLKIFIDKYKEAKLMLVPYSSSIYKDYYSEYLKMVDEVTIIQQIFDYIGVENSISIIDELDGDDLYYKTDHHWTTDGAYIAYENYCDKLGIKSISKDEFQMKTASDFLGTFYSKSKYFEAKADTLEYYEMPHLQMRIDGKENYESIYKLENLKKRDKYSVFLDGNHSKVTIKNEKLNDGSRILVIKDSFANSLIPFVANNYEEVIVLDLRHFNYKLSEFLEINTFDDILALYSLDTLASDKTIAKINF